jgi:hypothetical protein
MKDRLIVIDPPWPEYGGGKSKRGADRHYSLLKLREIVPTILAAQWEDGSPVWNPDPEGCHVWIWSTQVAYTNQHVFKMADQLGIRLVSQRVWVKSEPLSEISRGILFDAMDVALTELSTKQTRAIERDLQRGYVLQNAGLGQYNRGLHEVVHLGIIGRLPPAVRTIQSVIPDARREHSRKPDSFFDDALALAGEPAVGRATEMFARTPRPGWKVWGDEVELSM